MLMITVRLFSVDAIHDGMPPEYVDALVETAPEGIAFDDLTVTGDDRYRFRTPDSDYSDLSAAELREVTADSAYATNWYFWHARAPQKAARWSFLRWLEGAGETDRAVPERYDALADGITTEWGQLRITASLGAKGRRRYAVRHVDDAETPADQLVTYEEPSAARKLATEDDDGRYRPLKTAPSLRTGWQFQALDAAELVETVDLFYPATVANWHREREKTLDICHWHETVERQTGIYGVVETWDRGDGHEHVEWVAETHCTDEECLKRRQWEYDDGTALDTDGGDGSFPCREPCSLVISAARKYTRLDAEESQTYELELTPSEKRQLEELIDAVADGRTESIREADFDEGANRFRTRFLRAKRVDEAGRLCGSDDEK